MPYTFYNLRLYKSKTIATKNFKINVLFALYVGGWAESGNLSILKLLHYSLLLHNSSSL